MTDLLGKMILNSYLILKYLQYSINKNTVVQFETHKHNAKPNTVILTNITAVTGSKHSDSDTELACFVMVSNLYIT